MIEFRGIEGILGKYTYSCWAQDENIDTALKYKVGASNQLS